MVFRSGEYSWKPGMTLQSLFDQAKGLKPGYDNQQINIFRYVSDTQRKIIVFDLTKIHLISLYWKIGIL